MLCRGLAERAARAEAFERIVSADTGILRSAVSFRATLTLLGEVSPAQASA